MSKGAVEILEARVATLERQLAIVTGFITRNIWSEGMDVGCKLGRLQDWEWDLHQQNGVAVLANMLPEKADES